jgi:hypothetical protein
MDINIWKKITFKNLKLAHRSFKNFASLEIFELQLKFYYKIF